MEVDSWALFSAPSLPTLIPLVIYIVMVFMGKDNTSGIIVDIAITTVVMNQDPRMLAAAFTQNLDSTTALIGTIIMTSAGPGVLMTETKITHTLVYWIVEDVGVNTQTKTKIVLIICSILICGLLGALNGGNTVIASIMIPVMASLGITPTMVTALFKVSGEIGLMLGPLTGVTLITMEVTNLSYGQLMIGAAIPFSLFWLGGMQFAVRHIRRRIEGKGKYELGDGVTNLGNIVITPRERPIAIAFLTSFVLLAAYGIMTKQRTSYTLIVTILLAVVINLFACVDIGHTVGSSCEGIAGQAHMFIVFVTIGVLLSLVTLGGGFNALSNPLDNAASDGPTAVTLIASVVGDFGIEAAAVAEIKIIAEMFGAAAVSTGLPTSMFAVSTLAATRLTGSVYLTASMIGQLGVTHPNNIKEMLQASQIASGIIMVLILIWAFIGPMILA